MILTKAIITELPKDGENIFKCRVPLMEDNTRQDAIFDALLCAPPGIYGGYKVGDVVFVDFENDRYDTAVIHGKLYTKIEEDSSTYAILNNLKVEGRADLSNDSKLGGFTGGDIFTVYQTVDGGNFKYKEVRE